MRATLKVTDDYNDKKPVGHATVGVKLAPNAEFFEVVTDREGKAEIKVPSATTKHISLQLLDASEDVVQPRLELCEPPWHNWGVPRFPVEGTPVRVTTPIDVKQSEGGRTRGGMQRGASGAGGRVGKGGKWPRRTSGPRGRPPRGRFAQGGE